jgi:hypothetical protein
MGMGAIAALLPLLLLKCSPPLQSGVPAPRPSHAQNVDPLASASASAASAATTSKPEEPDENPSSATAPVTVPLPPSEPENLATSPMWKDDYRSCKQKGGILQPVCMSGSVFCVIPYRNAGKPCRSKKECGGECPLDETGVGICESDNRPCGCKFPAFDANGKKTFLRCLD